ncbi:MAG: calcium/sodium antiporter [Phycisphaerae bacterium]
MNLALFLGGLLLLLGGGRILVSGSIDLARRLNVPQLLVGLTIVAWGTSAPELAFNLTAALQNKPDLIFGNIVGANISNLGLVLGISALITPLAVASEIVRREIPLMIGMFALFAVLASGSHLADAAGGRLEGLLLLTAFAIYTGFAIQSGLRAKPADAPIEQQTSAAEIVINAPQTLWLSITMIVGGLALLGIGGNLAAGGATGMAQSLGLSDRVIGLTVVAVGTTLPELITSITAVLRKQTDLAVGNAVGSCLFNAGLIYGVCGLIVPAEVPADGRMAVGAMLLLGVLLWPMSKTFNAHIARVEGGALLAIYCITIAIELLRGG